VPSDQIPTLLAGHRLPHGIELGNGSDCGARTVGSYWSRDRRLSSSDAAAFSHKAVARIAKPIRSLAVDAMAVLLQNSRGVLFSSQVATMRADIDVPFIPHGRLVSRTRPGLNSASRQDSARTIRQRGPPWRRLAARLSSITAATAFPSETAPTAPARYCRMPCGRGRTGTHTRLPSAELVEPSRQPLRLSGVYQPTQAAGY
jgi:hypothetical protein